MNTEISAKVRAKVKERDSWDGRTCCIYCGSPYNVELHHYIERSRGGKGVEQNLISLCTRCHARLHSGEREIRDFCEIYLTEHYPNWNEKDLIYRKGEDSE